MSQAKFLDSLDIVTQSLRSSDYKGILNNPTSMTDPCMPKQLANRNLAPEIPWWYITSQGGVITKSSGLPDKSSSNIERLLDQVS